MNRVIWFSLSLIAVVCVALVDWVTGDQFSFFTFYFLPISVAAWYVNFESSIAIAVVSVLAWFTVDYSLAHNHSSHFSYVWNSLVRLGAFVVIAFTMSKINIILKRERKLSEQLNKSISEIKVLESFLSICCECKKIRNEEGQWQQMESYISQHSDTRFSHGFCPECFQKQMKEAGLS